MTRIIPPRADCPTCNGTGGYRFKDEVDDLERKKGQSNGYRRCYCTYEPGINEPVPEFYQHCQRLALKEVIRRRGGRYMDALRFIVNVTVPPIDLNLADKKALAQFEKDWQTYDKRMTEARADAAMPVATTDITKREYGDEY
jgi:hypothetical protein